MSVKSTFPFFNSELLEKFKAALANEDESIRCNAVFALFAEQIGDKDLDEEEERLLFIAKQCALQSRDASHCMQLCSIMKGLVDEGVCSFYIRLQSDYAFDTNSRAQASHQYFPTSK